MTKEEMVCKFQCPGCACGSDTDCGNFYLIDEDASFWCGKHVPGTRVMGIRSSLIVLGLPKGFNRIGEDQPHGPCVRLSLAESDVLSNWNRTNIPVWALEQNGFLFVRTYSPRVNVAIVDIIENGKIDLVPTAIDVGKFIDEID